MSPDLNGFIFPFDTQVLGWDREERYIDEYYDPIEFPDDWLDLSKRVNI